MSTDTGTTERLADNAVTSLRHQADYERLKKALNWLRDGAIVDATFTTHTGDQKGRAVVVYGRLVRDPGSLALVLDAPVDADHRRHWATSILLRDEKGTPHYHLVLAIPCYEPAIVKLLDGDVDEQTAMFERYKEQVGLY